MAGVVRGHSLTSILEQALAETVDHLETNPPPGLLDSGFRRSDGVQLPSVSRKFRQEPSMRPGSC